MRDITLEDTIYIAFTTRAFATGIPTVLAGTPIVSAYENADLTQITAGITLGVDHDTVAGLNMLTVAATAANGYESGKDYNLVITQGTVGGVSVVGEVVGQFSIGRSAAAVDLANGTDGLGAIKADTAAILTDTGTTLENHLTDIKGTGFVKDTHSLIDIETFVDLIDDGTSGLAKIAADVAAILNDTDLIDDATSGLAKIAADVAAVLVDTGTTLDGKINTIDTNVDAILVDTGTTIPGTIATLQADTDDIQTRLPAALVGGRMDSDVEAINNVTAAATNLENLFGSVVRDPNVASATATTIVFDDALAVGTDDLYIGMTVYIYGGTGIGQARTIVDYAGATKTAIVHPNWGITPDATSDVMILPFGSTAAATTLATGTAQAGTASTIQLVATSAFADDELNGNIISIVNGTGRGQTRAITDYASATDTATVVPNWDTTPDATSVYEVKGGSANGFSIADQVWEEAQADHATAGTFGETATEIASILADTNELQTDDVPGLIAALNDPTAAAVAVAVWDALQASHVGVGTFGEIATEIASILADSNELQADDVPGLIAALNDLSAAQVNAEVVDVLFTDTISELAQAIPAATPTVATAIMLVYMALRNKLDITSSTMEIHNDAGTVIAKKALTDDGSVYSEAEAVAGP
jgi:hypothetical protein